MLKRIFVRTVLAVGCGLSLASVAGAQSPSPVLGGPGAFPVDPYTSPTVSPYINLGVNPSNGLSNYQTLVRPLIDDRDAILRQTANLQQLQQQLRRRPGGQPERDANRQDPNARTGPGHFMHYSHYFNGIR